MKELEHKKDSISRINLESSQNLQPASKLLQDREQDLLKLEMELKMLEGDADEDSLLTSSNAML